MRQGICCDLECPSFAIDTAKIDMHVGWMDTMHHPYSILVAAGYSLSNHHDFTFFVVGVVSIDYRTQIILSNRLRFPLGCAILTL